MPVYGGRPFRFAAHGERLTRSLAGISMEDPHTREEWRAILGTLIERNGGGDLLRVLAGDARRAARPQPRAAAAHPAHGVRLLRPAAACRLPTCSTAASSCVTAADTRWARCDIKSIALLANVLLRQLSVEAAAAETILLRDGELTEASASAVHVVLGGEVLMPPNSRRILPGTTRGVVEEMAARAAIHCRVVPISEAQLRARGRGVALGRDARSAAGDRDRRPRRRHGQARAAVAAGVRGAAALQAGARGDAVVSGAALLEFPTDYPLKVVGRPTGRVPRPGARDRAAPRAGAAGRQHVRERLSANGNFLSISYLLPRREPRADRGAGRRAAPLRRRSDAALGIARAITALSPAYRTGDQ